MKEKIIIFDASTIINFIMNGLTDILKELKLIFQGKFIITNKIKKEVVDRPLTIKKFKLGALTVQKLIDEQVFEFPNSIGIKNFDLNKKTREILKSVNQLYKADNENIKLIHDGEASCLALAILASKKGIKSLLAVDERTTRILIERPENLKKLLKRKLHKSIKLKGNLDLPTKQIKIIRSSELVYVAFKKHLIKLKPENKQVLDALLYATKFKGAAISNDEIEQIKRL